MKTCNVCDHEYLDTYESCPFCARNIAEDRGADVPDIDFRYEKHHRELNYKLIAGVLGSPLLLIILYLLFQMFFVTTTAEPATDTAVREACFYTEDLIENAAAVQFATNGAAVTDLASLVPSSFEALPTCPSGGVYSLDSSDPEFPTVTCSIHGSRAAPLE